jgi:hypothetical protein
MIAENAHQKETADANKGNSLKKAFHNRYGVVFPHNDYFYDWLHNWIIFFRNINATEALDIR